MPYVKRREDLKKIAYHLDMQYEPKDEWGLYNLLRDFRLFRRGHHRRITNILSKKNAMLDLSLHVFDYRFVISTGNSHRRVNQTVFFVESRNLGLPDFLMKPETFFHRIGEYLGMQDIDFEAYPDFSRQYLLKGANEDHIRSSLGKKKFLRFFSIEKNWSLEGCNYYMVFYSRNMILPPNHIGRFVEKGMNIFEMLKLND